MRLNFFRRIRILPGLWLNVSKKSVSATVGVRGLKTTFGKQGRRTTVGLPGTGLSLTGVAKPNVRTSDEDVGATLLSKALRDKGRSRR
ncbi:DUF4236 domain-containing protein [Brevundimonas sp.]|uniref:DUF4236 domain-containing protein n=1 Tax=Brevundimonas sp. TaxID=1871086 RepID=UPI002FC716BB